MKLSIIIPTYKQDSYYLYQCINSIYNQINFDYKDLEVLVVKDDLEPISTVGCISSFPIKLIQTPKNLGCAGARELGIAHSTGDYIYFMDSDDFLFSPLSLSHMLKIVEEHQDYDW